MTAPTSDARHHAAVARLRASSLLIQISQVDARIVLDAMTDHLADLRRRAARRGASAAEATRRATLLARVLTVVEDKMDWSYNYLQEQADDLEARIARHEAELKQPAISFSGQDLRRHRQRLGLTQRALAEALGMHPNTVARMERGTLPITRRTERAVEQLRAN